MRLEKFLSIHCKKYITPHILTELSNLVRYKENNINFSDSIDSIKDKLNEYEEISFAKEEILGDQMVNQFGITDTSIKLLSEKNNKIIFTKDKSLCIYCKYAKKLPAIHINDLESLFLTLTMFKE